MEGKIGAMVEIWCNSSIHKFCLIGVVIRRVIVAEHFLEFINTIYCSTEEFVVLIL